MLYLFKLFSSLPKLFDFRLVTGDVSYFLFFVHHISVSVFVFFRFFLEIAPPIIVTFTITCF